MSSETPIPDSDAAPRDADAAEVRRVWRSRRGVHRVSVAVRMLGWLAAAGCLLVGAAAVVVWAWRAFGASAS